MYYSLPLCKPEVPLPPGARYGASESWTCQVCEGIGLCSQSPCRAGEARGSDGQAALGEGRWELPYLADENADEDPELRVTAAGDAAAQRLRDAFLASAKPVCKRIAQQAPDEMLQLRCHACAR